MHTFRGGAISWDSIFTFFVSIVLVCGLLSVVIHKWLHVYIFPERNLVEKGPAFVKKKKFSLRDSLHYIKSSNYLICIVVIVLGYNLVINLTEVLWKSQMKECFPNPQDYAHYMSGITFYIGVFATLGSFFISGNIIRLLGWRFAALTTPVIVSITGVFFFYFLFLKQYFPGVSALPVMLAGFSPLTLAVWFGSAQNVLTRASKYTVFDDTKEMAFIPLGSEGRFKGKSAIDGIGSRFGKSGSSFLLQGLFVIFGSPAAASWCIAMIMAVVVPVWVYSINSLSTKFESVAAPRTEQ